MSELLDANNDCSTSSSNSRHGPQQTSHRSNPFLLHQRLELPSLEPVYPNVQETSREYRRSCLLEEVTDFAYTETLGRLHDLFNKNRSLFADRYNCMRYSKQNEGNIRH
ncbi:hypothetical protein Tcan_03701 [Toxocara canis]|uniref:Uncharacterized protein n=1 Tax=Toxocara canis TaxID=6265 RepID=A0A0B2VCC7_TOXCA|nr:hypothetical protein Tcan_03701 [Toxocara canis]